MGIAFPILQELWPGQECGEPWEEGVLSASPGAGAARCHRRDNPFPPGCCLKDVKKLKGFE